MVLQNLTLFSWILFSYFLQSINDPDMKSGVQASATTVETSAIASTTSGPVSVTSLEEEVEPDPNATYACVSISAVTPDQRGVLIRGVS